VREPENRWMFRGVTAALCATVAFVTWAAGSAPAEETLTNADEIARFAGREADRCVYAAPNLEICRWHMEARMLDADRSQEAASAGGVHLICERPIDAGAEVGAGCVVHPIAAPDVLPAVAAAPTDLTLPAVPMTRTSSWEKIQEAGTVKSLSHLFGDIPNICRTTLDAQTCQWWVGEEAPRHDLLTSITGTGGTLVLRCVLPLDGSERASGSCVVFHN